MPDGGASAVSKCFGDRDSGGALEGGTSKNNGELPGFEHFEYGLWLQQTPGIPMEAEGKEEASLGYVVVKCLRLPQDRQCLK